MELLARDENKNRIIRVGIIIGDTLFKKVIQSKHFMRVVNGYGIQESAFEQLKKRQIKKIIIKEEDTGFEWETTTEVWDKHGKTANYGNGRQRFLSLKYLNAHKKPKPISEILLKREVEQIKLL